LFGAELGSDEAEYPWIAIRTRIVERLERARRPQLFQPKHMPVRAIERQPRAPSLNIIKCIV
jgi:hypothetical protein